MTVATRKMLWNLMLRPQADVRTELFPLGFRVAPTHLNSPVQGRARMQSLFLFFVRAGAPLFVAFVVYVASYSPFLKFAADSDSPYYRSPVLYRPVEWVILRTPLQVPLLWWSEFVGARSKTELQIWFFAQGISDPPTQIHFNFQ